MLLISQPQNTDDASEVDSTTLLIEGSKEEGKIWWGYKRIQQQLCFFTVNAMRVPKVFKCERVGPHCVYLACIKLVPIEYSGAYMRWIKLGLESS